MSDILTVTMNPALDVSARTGQIHPTRKLRCDQAERHPGGCGINAARVLHRLGADCAALCLLGGPSGQMVARLLADEGVPCIAVPIAGHTRESFTVQERASRQEYRFVLPGPDVSMPELDAFVGALTAQPSPRFLVTSGSLPPGVPAHFYVQLAKTAVGAGDRFVAGLVWALSQGHALDRAFAYGVSAGSAALSSTGTGLCAPQDVHTGVQSVKLLSEFPELAL